MCPAIPTQIFVYVRLMVAIGGRQQSQIGGCYGGHDRRAADWAGRKAWDGMGLAESLDAAVSR